MKIELPEDTRRLFESYNDLDPSATSNAGLIFAKLMEEGNSNDLVWLTGLFPESQMAEWLGRHGRRLLSRRSRIFWQQLLDRPEPAHLRAGDDLWPL